MKIIMKVNENTICEADLNNSSVSFITNVHNIIVKSEEYKRIGIFCHYNHQAYNLYSCMIPIDYDDDVSMIYDNAGTWYGWLQGYLQYFENDRKLLIGIDMYTANSSDEAAKQEIFAQLRESDYLFILNINDNIRNIFRDVTKDDIGESTVYTVKKDGDKVRLEKS